MLSVMRVINGNHICITKPTSVLLKEYYYNKKKVCNMIVHAMVDNQKRFLNVFVGLFVSVNDSCLLRKSKLYQYAIHGKLFDMVVWSQENFHMDCQIYMECLYIYLTIKATHYFFKWLVTPHKKGKQHLMLELLYDRKHKRGRLVVEITFKLMTKNFILKLFLKICT